MRVPTRNNQGNALTSSEKEVPTRSSRTLTSIPTERKLRTPTRNNQENALTNTVTEVPMETHEHTEGTKSAYTKGTPEGTHSRHHRDTEVANGVTERTHPRTYQGCRTSCEANRTATDQPYMYIVAVFPVNSRWRSANLRNEKFTQRKFTQLCVPVCTNSP